MTSPILQLCECTGSGLGPFSPSRSPLGCWPACWELWLINLIDSLIKCLLETGSRITVLHAVGWLLLATVLNSHQECACRPALCMCEARTSRLPRFTLMRLRLAPPADTHKSALCSRCCSSQSPGGWGGGALHQTSPLLSTTDAPTCFVYAIPPAWHLCGSHEICKSTRLTHSARKTAAWGSEMHRNKLLLRVMVQ